MFLVPVARSASDLSRSFDRLFDSAFGAEPALRTPSLDVAETEGGYNVSIDLPGVGKDDVKITIDGRRVSVSAQTQREETKKAANDGSRVIYRERSSQSFARSFTLPEEVDQDASQAKLDSGVLSLTLAKKRAAASKQLTIN
jgi:HSP20 family protein